MDDGPRDDSLTDDQRVALPPWSGWWDWAIWRKTWGDQRVLVLSLVALWGVFPWLFIWLSAQIR